MDELKCRALKDGLTSQPAPQIVPVERFFDGNDDLGSIGCNLMEHPGVDVFRRTLSGLLNRQDVQGVYLQISELDPGEGCWPFSDIVLVAGTISPDDLHEAIGILQPNEVWVKKTAEVPSFISTRHGSPVLAVWWD